MVKFITIVRTGLLMLVVDKLIWDCKF